jgi:hypothetical protein
MTIATAALAPADNPGSWGTFFTLTATVAAALTGLLFVGFSLRPRDLQLSLAIRTRARHALTGLRDRPRFSVRPHAGPVACRSGG